jgi:hypothetical protein
MVSKTAGRCLLVRRWDASGKVQVTEARTWLLLAYKVPRDPTASRVYVWRKLKKLGAVALQDAVWVLPNTPQTLEQFRWLAAEIMEMDGKASLWESRHMLGGQNEVLVKEFQLLVEEPYRVILTAMKKRNPDLSALSRQYQQALTQDYFRCELGRKVRDALVAAKGYVS